MRLILAMMDVLLGQSQHGLRVRSDTLVSFMIGPLVRTCTFESMRKFRKGKIHLFRPTRSSRFLRYRVMVNSQGVMLIRTRSLVSHARRLKVPFCSFIGAPFVCPLLVFCCMFIISLLSLACFFVSLGLKNERWAPGI